ncbi:MAG: DUF3616 domain-containing protein [Caldilinea sp. CFX5]|nr:DUF3616 domain-containing protein [Caldilinea sp. CFX5]
MNRVDALFLTFDPQLNKLSKKKELRHGLSAVVQLGDTLWVANDESITLERLAIQGIDAEGTYHYGGHEQFALHDYLALPAPPTADDKEIEEADIEGLAYADGYLWLVGSHSRKRKTVKPKSTVQQNFARLAEVSSDGNRFLLARIPVMAKDGTYTLVKEVAENAENGEKRTAAQLPCTTTSSALTAALATDAHLQDFLPIPGKDNGFDIEGLAVVGDHLLVGLRGPVLRGWAVILEVAVAVNPANPAELQLQPINPDNPHNPTQPTYRKHFLDLDGLGVRDLCVDGADLLILAGPTLVLDGAVTVFRWPGGAQVTQERLVARDELVKVMDIPHNNGEDYAEGITLFRTGDGVADSLLVVYDAVSQQRQVGESAVKVDRFALTPLVEMADFPV